VTLEVPALSEFDDGKLGGRVESVGLEAGAAQAGRADYSVVVSLDTAGLRRVGISRLNRGYTVTGKIVTRSGSVLAMLRRHFIGQP
jgi:hypothetical protein